jgi:hypothetical protein
MVPAMRSVLRSPRAVTAAGLVGLLVYAYLAAAGTPAPWVALVNPGASALELHGGVVFDVRFPDNMDAVTKAAAIAAIDARLVATGVSASHHDDLGVVRFTGAGLDPGQPALALALATTPAHLEFLDERTTGPIIDAIQHGGDLPPGVERDLDTWSRPDGTRATAVYLRATDPDALRAAIALLPEDPAARVLVEEVALRDARPDRDPHYLRTHVVARAPVLDGGDVERAEVTRSPYDDRPQVTLSFTRHGGEVFGAWTAAHVGDKLAIVFDDRVQSAPVIDSAIYGGRAVIAMGMLGDPAAAARALAGSLGHGPPLPAGLRAELVATAAADTWRTTLAALIAALVAALATLLIALPFVRARQFTAAVATAGWLPPAIVHPARGATASARGQLAVRIAVTIGVPIALLVLGGITLPGLDPDAIAALTRTGAAPTLTIGAVGATPILTAYVLIEVLALIVPGWRRRRGGDRATRTPLRNATALLAAAFAVVQAWMLTLFLASGPSPLLADGSTGWLVISAIACGVAALATGAWLIERFGIGAGWSVVLAGAAIHELIGAARHATGATALIWLAEGALVAALVTWSTRTRLAGRVRLPVGGFVGAAALTSVLGALILPLVWLPAVAELAIRATAAVQGPWVRLAIAIAGGAGLGALWSRRLAGPARAAAIAISSGAAAVFTLVAALATDATGATVTPVAALVTVVALDLATELRARLRADRWIAVAELHDVDEVDDALAAGGPRFARGVHHRALLRLFGSFVPITIFQRDPDTAP